MPFLRKLAVFACIIFPTGATIAIPPHLPNDIIVEQLQVVKNIDQFRKQNPGALLPDQILNMLTGVIFQAELRSQYNWVVYFKDMKADPALTRNFADYLIGNIYGLAAKILYYAAAKPLGRNEVLQLLNCAQPFDDLYNFLDHHRENATVNLYQIASALEGQLHTSVRLYMKTRNPFYLKRMAERYQKFANLALNKPL